MQSVCFLYKTGQVDGIFFCAGNCFKEYWISLYLVCFLTVEDQCDRVNRQTGFCKSSISHSTNRKYFFFLYFFKSGTHVSFDRLEKCFILATIQSPLSTRRVEASLYIVSKITSYKEKGSSSAWELIKWLARGKCVDLLKIISSS